MDIWAGRHDFSEEGQAAHRTSVQEPFPIVSDNVTSLRSISIKLQPNRDSMANLIDFAFPSLGWRAMVAHPVCRDPAQPLRGKGEDGGSRQEPSNLMIQ
jgi:hypothetical protein